VNATPICLRFGDYGSEAPGSKAFFHDFSGIAALGDSLCLGRAARAKEAAGLSAPFARQGF